MAIEGTPLGSLDVASSAGKVDGVCAVDVKELEAVRWEKALLRRLACIAKPPAE
jgi:hypothetical protein